MPSSWLKSRKKAGHSLNDADWQSAARDLCINHEKWFVNGRSNVFRKSASHSYVCFVDHHDSEKDF
jgi:hypothetical protein